jgi:ABC-type branched-subunit amino acid transport system substrate-binding protein
LGGKEESLYYYPEGETNFKDIFNRIRKKKLQQEKYKTMISQGLAVPAADSLLDIQDDTTLVFVGGIFLPCNKEEIIALASQAIHYGVKGQLLGTSVWHSADLIRQNKKAVEGTIFCVDFIPGASPKKWEEFRSLFLKQYNTEPDRVAGQAFDTAILLCNAILESKEHATAKDICDYLSKTQTFEGISGKISFDPLEHLNREGMILRVLNGSFVRVQ